MQPSLVELIAAGNFQYVNSMFDPCNSHLWAIEPGDQLRKGEFVLLTIPGSFYLMDDIIEKMLAQEYWLELATAYELVAYAASQGQNRWDGSSKVMALGSRFGSGAWPVLSFVPGVGRFLELEPSYSDRLWRNDRSVLCIKRG